MKIAVITYNAPHRKTQDLVYRLLLSGHSDITLVVLPFEQRPYKPLYEHRPPVAIHTHPQTMSITLGLNHVLLDICKLNDYFEGEKFDRILIGGCGLLPESLIKFNIINAHPGFLPIVRGLDSFKWAILKGLTIGVTTHFIGVGADLGVLIDRMSIERLPNDTFHSLAYRQYELEVNMLVSAITAKPAGTSLEEDRNFPVYPATKRMTHIEELSMMKKFNN